MCMSGHSLGEREACLPRQPDGAGAAQGRYRGGASRRGGANAASPEPGPASRSGLACSGLAAPGEAAMEAAGGGGAAAGIALHDFSGQLGEQRVHFHAMRLRDSLFLWVGAAPALASLAVAMCSPRVSVAAGLPPAPRSP